MSATTFLRRRNYAGDTCKNEEFPAATFGKKVCIFRYLGVAKNINGIGTIAAKNQQMQSSACGEFSYMMQNATEAASSMSENQKQKAIERIKKVGEDIVNSAAYKDWVNDQNIKR